MRQHGIRAFATAFLLVWLASTGALSADEIVVTNTATVTWENPPPEVEGEVSWSADVTIRRSLLAVPALDTAGQVGLVLALAGAAFVVLRRRAVRG